MLMFYAIVSQHNWIAFYITVGFPEFYKHYSFIFIQTPIKFRPKSVLDQKSISISNLSQAISTILCHYISNLFHQISYLILRKHFFSHLIVFSSFATSTYSVASPICQQRKNGLIFFPTFPTDFLPFLFNSAILPQYWIRHCLKPRDHHK